MGWTFHIACKSCKCLLPLPDLATEGQSDLAHSRGRFGPDQLRLLESCLGADNAAVGRARAFVGEHATHGPKGVVLATPERGDWSEYYEGIRRPTTDEFLATIEERGRREVVIRVLLAARFCEGDRIADPIVALALRSDDPEVRVASRCALAELRDGAQVLRARQRMFEADIARFTALSLHEQELVVDGARGDPTSHAEWAAGLLRDSSCRVRPHAAMVLAMTGDLAWLPDLAGMLGTGDGHLAGALANATRALLAARPRSRDVLAPYADVVLARVKEQSTWRRDLWLPLLKWCGDPGRELLEALAKGAPDPDFRPPDVHRELGFAGYAAGT